jgi:uncharacterized protein YjbI with pentapeptide repeats
MRRGPEGESLRDRTLAQLRSRAEPPRPETEPLDLRDIPLTGEQLAGLDFSRADLSGADLTRADLSGACLRGSKLHGASLNGAKLTGAELLGADLSEADLSECVGHSVGFGGADLHGAKLFNADLEGATFTKSSLAGADLRAAKLRKSRFLEADLTGAELSRADMRGAELEHSAVGGASFVETDLRNASLRGLSGHETANWIGTDIVGVDFCGAYLVRRTIGDQNYLHEFRTQNRLNAVLYQLWWLSSDCGRSFMRWGLWTVFFMAVFAGLYQFVAVDYGPHETFLSPLYYSVVTLTTLGYGDVLPMSPAAQLVAMAEVVMGYVMLGGLLSIFSNKMARRAD